MDKYSEEAKQKRFDLLKSIAVALFFTVLCSCFIGASVVAGKWFVVAITLTVVLVNVIGITRDVAMLWMSGYYYGKKVGYEELYTEIWVENRKKRAKREAERWRGVQNETIDI